VTDTAVQHLGSREGLRTESPDSVTLVPMALPGSSPLRDPKKERFCRLRAVLRPKADAYRQAGWNSESNHAAAGNASRLERRQDIAERIAYLSRQEDEILRIKRERIEEFLWTVHEANVADMWEMVEVEKRDHKGNPIINEDGSVVMKWVQRPKSINEMPEDVQRAVESISINEAGFVVPKPYSKLQANQELRKMLGIGSVVRDDGELSRLTDQELVAQLANQARELGIEVDLTYRFGGQ
jgi:Terminase small subunit